MPSLRQKRPTAARLVRMPCVLYRWSASSSCVQLARASPCLAGPSMTQRLTSSALQGGDLAGLARGFAWTQAVEAAFEVGVEPTLDGARGDGQIFCDLFAGPVAGGKADDVDAVSVFGFGLFAESLIQPLGLLLRQTDA